MKTEWWDRKAEELQQHTHSNKMKAFHSGLKAVCGTTPANITPIESVDGSQIFTDNNDITN